MDGSTLKGFSSKFGQYVPAGVQNTGATNGISNLQKFFSSSPNILKLQDEAETKSTQQTDHNILTAMGYLTGNLGAGIVSFGEGIWDFVAGGVASLFGADEWAKEQFDIDVAGGIRQDLADWYNPETQMQFAGDVMSGIGFSLPSIALAVVTGGTSVAITAGAIATGVAAGGLSTGEAYKKTGELGLKEFGYGTVSGVTEGALEAATMGAGSALKNLGKAVGKNAIKSVGRQTLVKSIGKEFVSEAVEEGTSALLDPFYQRAFNIDPNAQVNMEDVLYQAFVGGVSGGILGGASHGISSAANVRRGNSVIKNGRTDAVINTAKEFTEYGNKVNAKEEIFSYTDSLIAEYENLKIKDGVKGKMLLGEIARNATILTQMPAIHESKSAILENADWYAEKIASMNLTDENGKPLKPTAEEIRTNDKVLTQLAILDYACKLNVSARSEGIVQTRLANSKAAFTQWRNDATPADLKDASKVLGIDVTTATFEDIQTAIADKQVNYKQIEADAMERERQIREGADPKAMQKHAVAETTKAEQQTANTDIEPAAQTTNNIEQQGVDTTAQQSATNTVEQQTANVDTKAAAETSTKKNVKKPKRNRNVLSKIVAQSKDNSVRIETEATAKAKAKAEADAKIAAETEARNKEFDKIKVGERSEAETFARENIEGFDTLSKPKRESIIDTVRMGKSMKVADADIKTAINMVALTGVQVSFADIKGDNHVVINGKNEADTIYINPNSKKAMKAILTHELVHSLEGTRGHHRLMKLAAKYMTDENVETLKGLYEEYYKQAGIELDEKTFVNEATANFVESELTDYDFTYKVAHEDPSIAKQMWTKLKDMVSYFKSKDRQGYRLTKQLEANFAKAVEQNKGREILVTKLYNATLKETNKDQATQPKTAAAYSLSYKDGKQKQSPPKSTKVTTNHSNMAMANLRYKAVNNTRNSVFKSDAAKTAINKSLDLIPTKGYNKSLSDTQRNNIEGSLFDSLNKFKTRNAMYNQAVTIANTMIENMKWENVSTEPDAKKYLTAQDMLTEAEITKAKQSIIASIMKVYDGGGKVSFKKWQAEKNAVALKNMMNRVKDAQAESQVRTKLVNAMTTLKQYANREYFDTTFLSDRRLQGWIEAFAKVVGKNNIVDNPGIRGLMVKFAEFYNESNAMLNPDDGVSYIDYNVLEALRSFKEAYEYRQNDPTPLDIDEMRNVITVCKGLEHLFKNYDTVVLNGKRESCTQVATEAINNLKDGINYNDRSTIKKRIRRGVFDFLAQAGDPTALLQALDGYDSNGILTRLFNDIKDGETKAKVMEIEMLRPLNDYLKNHKGYEKSLKQKVKLGNIEITKGQAISLYELSKRQQAEAGLKEAPIVFESEELGKVSFKWDGSIKELQKELSKNFTKEDMEYMDLVEDFFNKQSKEIKQRADEAILGYSNATEEFYFPIQRDSQSISRRITDARTIMRNIANVYNFSFNKDVKAGAKNSIYVKDVTATFRNHAKQLATYSNLTMPMQNFDRVYSKNIGDKANVNTLRKHFNDNVWDKTDTYLTTLFSDIQGGGEQIVGQTLLRRLQGAYAKFQLGFNLKVIASQTTSYANAHSYLDSDCLARGLSMNANKETQAEMMKYCPYEMVRDYDGGVVKADTLIDKVDATSDKLMRGVAWMDRYMTTKFWNACQLQVAKNGGTKVGTEANKVEAGKLLEQVLRGTQANSIASEKSGLMRSKSDIVRSFTMFTSDPMKSLSRLVERGGKVLYLMEKAKAGDADARAQLQQAKAELKRTVAGVGVSSMAFALLTQLFRNIRGTQDEDKSFLQATGEEFISTIIGFVPIVSSVYNFFTDNYDVSNFAFDTINSTLSAVKGCVTLAEDMANGKAVEEAEIGKTTQNVFNALGMLTGIPTRNINNVFKSFLKNTSPVESYKYLGTTKVQNVSTDVRNAVEEGNTEYATAILDILTNNTEVSSKLVSLYGNGYDVLPKRIGTSISLNGEKIELTAKQKTSMEQTYYGASQIIAETIKNMEGQSDEVVADAIKIIYSLSYEKALLDNFADKVNPSIAKMVADSMSWAEYAEIMANINAMKGDATKDGTILANSRKNKVLAYLNKLKLSNEQKLLILYKAGYTYKEGNIKGVTEAQAEKYLQSIKTYVESLKKETEE